MKDKETKIPPAPPPRKVPSIEEGTAIAEAAFQARGQQLQELGVTPCPKCKAGGRHKHG